MEKIAISFMLLAGVSLATIQIRGMIKGRWPLSFWGISKLAQPLDPTEKKLAIAGGLFFVLGLIFQCASF